MSWTFPDDIDPDLAGALDTLMSMFTEDGEPAAGFVNECVCVAHWMGQDGEDRWGVILPVGELRTMAVVGILESAKLQVLERLPGNPIGDLRADVDDLTH